MKLSNVFRRHHLPPMNKVTTGITVIGMLIAMILPLLPAQPATAQGGFNMPYGFIQDQVVVGMDRPTSFALAPDGRIYIAEKGGRVRVAVNGELLPDPFIDLSYEVNDSADRGLLGIALHPDFPSTPYVYLSYTYDPPEIKDRNPSGARVSRVLRLTADPANLNVAQEGSGMVILGTNSTADHVGNPDQGDTEPFSCFDDGGGFVRDCIANEGTAHSLDYMQFGPDGALYVSTGDGIVNSKGNSRALDINSLNGKILRIDPNTGEGLADNPFFDGDPGSNRSKVYALGLRNPFRFTVDPRDGKLIIGEVGNNNWEEINVGGAGSNFGWPCYEGPYEAATYANCDAFKNGSAVMTPGVYSYPHTQKDPQRGSAIGGDLYLGKAFPALYRGAYFFQDFNGGVVDFLTFNADGSADHHEFGSNIPGIVQMTTGDDGALYMLSVILNGLWRVRYAPGGNKPPTAVATADVQGGAAPLDVNFSSKRSTDPENSIVGYAWEFGDGATSSKANPVHTFEKDGVYDVALTVTDSAGDTSSTSIQVAVGAAPPVVEILEPGDGAKFRIGQEVVLKGKATDPDDGELSGDSLQWNVLLHHDKHIHYDAFKGSGNEASFVYDDHGDETWYEICLTATDSQGLEDTQCVEIKAEEVTYTFNSVPPGLPITYGGSSYKTPFKVNTYIDAKRILEAPLTAKNGLVFEKWSDGGDAVHDIVIQETAQTFTATYGDGSGAPVEDTTSAADLANAEVVTPEADTHTEGDGHTHTADEAATPAVDAAPAREAPAPTLAGRVIAQRWNNVGGATLEEFQKSSQYKSGTPSSADAITTLELPRGGGNDYGVRIRGYLLPPVDGDYRFWIAADDRGALFLSTDDTPDNKIVIAYTPESTHAGEYDKFTEQATGPIALEAGKRYYFEVLYKQGDAKDNLSVAWQIPGKDRAVIEGKYMAPFAE